MHIYKIIFNDWRYDAMLPYNDFEIADPKLSLIKISKLVFDRFLTDSCGGNLSIKNGDKIYLTPRYSGEYFHWDIPEDKVKVINLGNISDKIESDEISREIKLHIGIYKNFKEITSVIHAHPPFTIALSLQGMKINPVTHMLKGRVNGEILSCDPNLPQVSLQQTENIIEIIKSNFLICKYNSFILNLNSHGVIALGKNIFQAFSIIEALEINSKILFFSKK